jgi:glycine/D-amino acid oxidase-like deaminating enzyme
MSTAFITEPPRVTPVYGEFDVVVVGGGPAGIMAASAAARSGSSVLLIERYGFLGGAGTAGGLSTYLTIADGTDVDDLTRGELAGRQQALDAFTFIRDRTPGFEGSYIVGIAPQIGIRETRRIVGPYQLTEDDVLDCADLAASMALSAGVPGDAISVPDLQRRLEQGGTFLGRGAPGPVF